MDVPDVVAVSWSPSPANVPPETVTVALTSVELTGSVSAKSGEMVRAKPCSKLNAVVITDNGIGVVGSVSSKPYVPLALT